MTRRFNNQQSGSFYAPVQVNDPYTSQQYQDAVGALNQAFDQSYNSGSIQARHPVASKVGLALMGGLLGAASGAPSDQAGITGALGAVVAPMIGGRIERNRQAGVADQYQNQLRTLGEMERNLLPSRQSYGNTGTLGNTLEQMGLKSPVDANTPITADALKLLLDGGSAATSPVPDYQGVINNFKPPGFQGSPSPMGQAPAVTSSGNMEPAGLDTDPALNPAQLEASATEQAPPELRDYRYKSPALAANENEQVRALTQTLVAQFPNYAKLPYQQQLLIQQAANQQAIAALNQAKTQGQNIQNQYRPQYEKARIGKLNYRTPVQGRAPSHDEFLRNLYGADQLKQMGYGMPVQRGPGSAKPAADPAEAQFQQQVKNLVSAYGKGSPEVQTLVKQHDMRPFLPQPVQSGGGGNRGQARLSSGRVVNF